MVILFSKLCGIRCLLCCAPRDNTAPPFTIHVGGEATVEFAGLKFHWTIPSEIAFELVRQLYRQNFDPAFTSTAKIDYAIGIPLTHLVTSMTAPIASGWSVCRVGLAPTGKRRLRTAHTLSGHFGQ